jgi:ABC-2 type transport system ATP-binding protein
VIDLVGLSQSADRRIGEYSKGMMQRIGIAQAVLHKPELLVVDEPASGLDPGGQREMALLLRTLNDEGHTVFLCTHQLTEVARLCDRVGVLVNGRLDYTTSVAALHEQGHSVTIRVADLPAQTAKALYNLGPQVRCDRVSVTLFPVSDGLLASVLRRLLDDYVPIQAVTPEADALEQFYLGAIQGNLVTTTAQTTAFPEESFQTLYKDR